MLNLKEKAQIGKGTNIFNIIWFKLFRKGAIQSRAPFLEFTKIFKFSCNEVPYFFYYIYEWNYWKLLVRKKAGEKRYRMKREMNGKIAMIAAAAMLCFSGCGMESPAQEENTIGNGTDTGILDCLD